MPPIREQARLVETLGAAEQWQSRLYELAKATNAARLAIYLDYFLANRRSKANACVADVATVRNGTTPSRKNYEQPARLATITAVEWSPPRASTTPDRTIRIALRTERRKAVTGRFRREENKVPLNSEKPGKTRINSFQPGPRG